MYSNRFSCSDQEDRNNRNNHVQVYRHLWMPHGHRSGGYYQRRTHRGCAPSTNSDYSTGCACPCRAGYRYRAEINNAHDWSCSRLWLRCFFWSRASRCCSERLWTRRKDWTLLKPPQTTYRR